MGPIGREIDCRFGLVHDRVEAAAAVRFRPPASSRRNIAR
jgi:hypothetical protein